MSGGSVPNDEMPNILRPGRRDVPPLSDAVLAALLAGTEPPAEPAPELQPVADLLAALRAGPTGAELAGEARAAAEFRRGTGAPALSRRSRHRRPRVSASRLRGRVAAAGGIVALGLGCLMFAAFNGELPAPVQRAVHNMVPGTHAGGGSPGGTTQVHHAKGPTPSSQQRPAQNQAAPPPADPARLCRAYLRASAQGSHAHRVAAFRHLVKGAGRTDGLAAYCRQALPRWQGPWPPRPAGWRVPPGEGGQHHKSHPRGQDGRPARGVRQVRPRAASPVCTRPGGGAGVVPRPRRKTGCT